MISVRCRRFGRMLRSCGIMRWQGSARIDGSPCDRVSGRCVRCCSAGAGKGAAMLGLSHLLTCAKCPSRADPRRARRGTLMGKGDACPSLGTGPSTDARRSCATVCAAKRCRPCGEIVRFWPRNRVLARSDAVSGCFRDDRDLAVRKTPGRWIHSEGCFAGAVLELGFVAKKTAVCLHASNGVGFASAGFRAAARASPSALACGPRWALVIYRRGAAEKSERAGAVWLRRGQGRVAANGTGAVRRVADGCAVLGS